jgi:ATP-binding cassette subfamily B protein
MVAFLVAFPKFQLVQKLIDRLNLVTREKLEGMLVIRAFNTQAFERDRFDKANRDLTQVNLFVKRAMALMMPVMMLILNLTTVLIIWVGAEQVSAFKLDVGSMMAYMQYAMQIIMSFLMLAMMFIMVPRAAVSANRIKEVLETGETVLDPENSVPYGERFNADVTFNDVYFRYPGGEGDVLRGINFTARAGQTTAFIGSTGSGKTTLVNLIMRFYDVTGGEILVDGKDIRTVGKKDLRARIGYVPQKSVLFSGTIKSNLSYADKDAPFENIEKASSVAQAAEFIAQKEGGYEEPISQGGTNVSGGQKQRLSIARALVKNAPIYIFDDSFSALDLKTDARLRAALKEDTGEGTILIVAQRVGTIMNAEQIIVLDNGTIAGKGTHEELMESCGVYLEIARSQLSDEELSARRIERNREGGRG